MGVVTLAVLPDSHVYCLMPVPVCMAPLSPCLQLNVGPAVINLTIRTALRASEVLLSRFFSPSFH